MKEYNVCFLGFGNVGRALARLLVAKSTELRELYGIDCRITGVASRRIGWLTDSNAFEVSDLLSNSPLGDRSSTANNVNDWLRDAQPDAR